VSAPLSERVRVRQVRSGAGFARDQKATLVALGLGRIGKVRVHPNNPQIRGMLAKVTHLVTVEAADDTAAVVGRTR
jgi:large subunit ribosomal protein L30